jgi:putative CocE/NonD family hydrolase
MAEFPRDARRPGPAARILGTAAARAWALPRPRNPVTVTRGITIPAADGVPLLADHYAPVPVPGDGGGYPAILVRTPYGRTLFSSLANAQLLAGQGYHVLLVSCRGTFGSGGEFDPGRHEAADGQACVAWLRQQEWFDGRLATFGMSYLGFTQWALATDPPPELRAAVVIAGLHDFSTSVHARGTFSLHTSLWWADMVASQEAGGVRGMLAVATADRRERPAMDGNPVGPRARALLGSRSPWFDSWLRITDPADPYWAPLRCGAALERLSVPVLLIGGWHDIFLAQTIEQYQALSRRGVPVRLVIGPWTHMQLGTKGGGVTTREALAWLDRYLRPLDAAPAAGADGGTDSGADGGQVRVWFGEEGWRDLPGWPPAGTRQERWPLLPGGALGLPAPGAAGGGPHAGGEPPAGGEAAFRYDPAFPTPAVGGAVLPRTAAGVRDNRELERRPDVLVFTSEPLTAPVVIAGEPAAEVAVARDNRYADVFARLCDVDPSGRSRNVCDGIVRLGDADPLEGVVRVAMIGAAHRFAPGHRIRLQVSGGAHPRFARNPGTGTLDATDAELRDTRYRVRVGSGSGSDLLLPVLSA